MAAAVACLECWKLDVVEPTHQGRGVEESVDAGVEGEERLRTKRVCTALRDGLGTHP